MNSLAVCFNCKCIYKLSERAVRIGVYMIGGKSWQYDVARVFICLRLCGYGNGIYLSILSILWEYN